MEKRRVPTRAECERLLDPLTRGRQMQLPAWVAALLIGPGDDPATRKAAMAAFSMGVAFERAGFDVDPVPYLDPRRN